MSRYDDQFADGAAQLAHDLADVVGYTPAGGEAFDVLIIVGPEETIVNTEQDGEKRRHIRLCSIPATSRAADGGACVPEVTVHDVFEFKGVGYMIHHIIARTASITRVEAERIGTHEKTRQGLRRRN